MNTELAPVTMLQSMIVDFSNRTELTPVILDKRRARICELEAVMKTLEGAMTMEQCNEGKIKHHFGTGVYGRELFIPKGSIYVSKIHRGKTFNVIAKGCISVICPNNGYNTYTAVHTFVSEPFTKRIVIAHEDTIWITSHATDKTDLSEVENEIIAKDFSEAKLLQGDDL